MRVIRGGANGSYLRHGATKRFVGSFSVAPLSCHFAAYPMLPLVEGVLPPAVQFLLQLLCSYPIANTIQRRYLTTQAAVLEDALDGVQDSPMLSMEGVQSSRPSSRAGGGAGATVDEKGDESVQRMESLRGLLVAALHHHPDLPLGLCVKSEFPRVMCV